MTNRHFTAHHHGTDKLGLARLLEAFANDQWIGEKCWLQIRFRDHFVNTILPASRRRLMPS